eukprot:4957587-Alexandrium_andersonii.AAC.1
MALPCAVRQSLVGSQAPAALGSEPVAVLKPHWPSPDGSSPKNGYKQTKCPGTACTFAYLAR